ncbi:MAG: LysR family transcriptional regulator [Lentilitoribacter sp.]
MTISLKSMMYFTSAIRHQSIANAAAELNIAASAVSSAIDQIEADIGLKLVNRQRSRGIVANASGQVLAQKFERLLEDYRMILEEGAELKDALNGTLRIGYYAPVAPAFLPSILSSFIPKDSDVELHFEECDNDNAQAGLINGKYDVILFVSENVQPTIGFDVLVEAPAYCLVPKSHKLSTQSEVSIDQIAKEPLVILNRPIAKGYYQGLFDKHAGKISIAAYANSTEMVRSLVGAGFGCSVLNMKPQTAKSYGGDDLVSLPITDPIPPLNLSIGYDKKRPRRLVEHFANACLSYFHKTGSHRCLVD